MTHWGCCCEPEVLYFVPCAESPVGSGGFSGTVEEWRDVLGETPSVDDVYKYNDDKIGYCGEIKSEPDGASSPVTGASGSFEDVTDCDDSECPIVLLYFLPCNDDLCGTYVMAAPPSDWETFLGLPVDSIDVNDPSTYGGVYEFERTDGQQCCETDPDTGNPVESPCFRFCGQLGAFASGAICYDSTAFPAAERCLKCDVEEGKIQRIFPASGVTFTQRTGCGDERCPGECEKQPEVGDQWIRLDGTKTLTLSYVITGDCGIEQSGDCVINGDGETRLKLGVVLRYSHYMRVNANFQDPATVANWRRVLSGHCKEECTVINQASFLDNEWYSDWSFVSENCNDPVTETWSHNGTFRFEDNSQPINFAKLEKRLGIYGHAQLLQCTSDDPFFGDPRNDTVIDCFNEDACHLNFSNSGDLRLMLDWDETYTFTGSGIDDDYSGSFSKLITCACKTASAKEFDPCCPTDFTALDMYETSFNLGLENVVIQVFGTAESFESYGFNQLRTHTDWVDIIPIPDGSGATQKDFFGPTPANLGYGPTGGPMYLDQATENIDYFCGGTPAGWFFNYENTAEIGPTESTVGDYNRHLKIDAQISDVIEAIECVDGPPPNCEDGVIDVP